MVSHPSSFLIWGGGGHGKVVADLVRACGHQVAGFVDADAAKLEQTVESGGARVLFQQDEFLQHVRNHGCYPEGIDGIALAIGDNQTRQRGLLSLGTCCVPSLVHPAAAVSPLAALGRGTLVFAMSVINADAQIGDAVIINSAAVVEHDCVVADAAHISPGATLAGHVQVGARSWVGAGATVIQGIKIGADAMVGAGAAVIRDVPNGAIVAGVPAVPVKDSVRAKKKLS